MLQNQGVQLQLKGGGRTSNSKETYSHLYFPGALTPALFRTRACIIVFQPKLKGF